MGWTVFIVQLMSDDLKIEVKDLRSLAEKAGRHYHKAQVGKRIIDVPDVELKLVQRWIAELIVFETPKLPTFVTAYEPGSNIADNARIHASHRHMLHLDIADFFHSCDSRMVSDVFSSVRVEGSVEGRQQGRPLTDEDVSLLTLLSTLRGRLTVGSPSSPFLANRILLPFDYEVQAALGPSYAYSRYSDDMVVSSDDWIDVETVVAVVSDRLGRRSFRLNEAKTRCVGPGDKREITGVVVTPEGSLSVGRKRKRQLEHDLYQYLVHGEGSAQQILGMLDFCRAIEPSYVTKLLVKYKSYGKAATISGGVIAVLRVACANNGLVTVARGKDKGVADGI